MRLKKDQVPQFSVQKFVKIETQKAGEMKNSRENFYSQIGQK